MLRSLKKNHPSLNCTNQKCSHSLLFIPRSCYLAEYKKTLDFYFKDPTTTSPGAQCLRIHPPVQGHGFDSSCGKLPHATRPQACSLQLLSLRTLSLCSKRSHHEENPAHHSKEQPVLTATRESQCSEEDPGQPKIKQKFRLQKKILAAPALSHSVPAIHRAGKALCLGPHCLLGSQIKVFYLCLNQKKKKKKRMHRLEKTL